MSSVSSLAYPNMMSWPSASTLESSLPTCTPPRLVDADQYLAILGYQSLAVDAAQNVNEGSNPMFLTTPRTTQCKTRDSSTLPTPIVLAPPRGATASESNCSQLRAAPNRFKFWSHTAPFTISDPLFAMLQCDSSCMIQCRARSTLICALQDRPLEFGTHPAGDADKRWFHPDAGDSVFMPKFELLAMVGSAFHRGGNVGLVLRGGGRGRCWSADCGHRLVGAHGVAQRPGSRLALHL